jgi:hypothetical protein
MNPSAWPELEPYPVLRELFELQIDMLFADIRVLLRLPEQEQEGGCNLALATLLFNMISGSSVLFYNASVNALTHRGDRSQRFEGLLRSYYPWSEHDLAPEDAVAVLAEGGRHPLTHSLGIGPNKWITLPGSPEVQGTPVTLVFGKSALTPQQISDVATSRTCPSWLKETLWLSDHNRLIISVPTFTWGVHEMLRRLFSDEKQAVKAEQTMLQVREGEAESP